MTAKGKLVLLDTGNISYLGICYSCIPYGARKAVLQGDFGEDGSADCTLLSIYRASC